EGLRKDEIAQILAKEYSEIPESVFNPEKFLQLTEDSEYIATLGIGIDGLNNLEGFLFPDKYLLPKQADENYVIRTMVSNFLARTGSSFTYDTIIIASMVEREGRTNEDRPL